MRAGMGARGGETLRQGGRSKRQLGSFLESKLAIIIIRKFDSWVLSQKNREFMVICLWPFHIVQGFLVFNFYVVKVLISLLSGGCHWLSI